MKKSTLGSLTVRMSPEIKEWFRESFESSGTNSQGEFVGKLLETYNLDNKEKKSEIKTVTVEKELEQNQILINLNPSQLYALQGTILSNPMFAERQNELIDRLRGHQPIFYVGNLFKPEFKNIWVKNIIITKTMTDIEKQAAIRFNMAAFLINSFMVNIIEEEISETKITAKKLREFIQKNNIQNNIKVEPKTLEND